MKSLPCGLRSGVSGSFLRRFVVVHSEISGISKGHRNVHADTQDEEWGSAKFGEKVVFSNVQKQRKRVNDRISSSRDKPGARLEGSRRRGLPLSPSRKPFPSDEIDRFWLKKGVDPANSRSTPGKYRPDRQAMELHKAQSMSVVDLRKQVQGELLYGIHCVKLALSLSHRRPYRLLVLETLEKTSEDLKERRRKGAPESAAAEVAHIVETARERNIPIKYVSKFALNTLSDDRPHQGVILDCSPLSFKTVKHARDLALSLSSVPPVLVAADEMTDPQNLGALMRSTYFLGAFGLLVSSKNSSPLTPTVSRASAGAAEIFASQNKLFAATNLPRFLSSCAEEGWRILGADVSPGSVDISEITTGQPTVLVLGNEGSGLRTMVKKSCHTLVKISGPNRGQDGAVDSVNVSVAGGILLHHLTRSQ